MQRAIDAYNAGATATEAHYRELLAELEALSQESERHLREGLSEDELELFDLLRKDNLTKEETQKVKLAARHLLKRLVEEQPKLLVQDWYKDNQTRQQVRAEIERILDQELPMSYEQAEFKQKCNNVFELVFDYANRKERWAA